MLNETSNILHAPPKFLPLHDYDGIVEGNALRMDWGDILTQSRRGAECAEGGFDYIMGNPPFIGARNKAAEQAADMESVFGGKWSGLGNLDYVTAWYKKAVDYVLATKNTENTKFPDSISCEVLDKNGKAIGEKAFYNIPNDRMLTNWIERPKPNKTQCVPLTNAIEPPKAARRDQRGTKWSDGAVAFLCTGTNDMQNTNYVYLLSSGASRGHGLFANEHNLDKAACLFTVQHLIAHTWQNHNDQFLIPDAELSEEFKLDCLVYVLFHGKNLTASADGLVWNGKTWSIVNHFIPFTEEEVDAPGRFESDFMVRYLAGRDLSSEASVVRAAGLEIWCEYFKRLPSFDYSIRERFKLNRPDVGWYQIRQSLKAYGESSEGRPTDFTAFESAYAALSAKLRPQVYTLGFLK